MQMRIICFYGRQFRMLNKLRERMVRSSGGMGWCCQCMFVNVESGATVRVDGGAQWEMSMDFYGTEQQIDMKVDAISGVVLCFPAARSSD